MGARKCPAARHVLDHRPVGLPPTLGDLGREQVVRDVSAQRQAEDDLRFHKRLLDAAGDAVIATRPDGTVIYWSRSAVALYGWEADDVLGRNIVDVAPIEASREESARGRRPATPSTTC